MLTVWIPVRFQPNHSTTSISMVPGIFIVLFRLICWVQLGEPGVSTSQKKCCLPSTCEVDCVITGPASRLRVAY